MPNIHRKMYGEWVKNNQKRQKKNRQKRQKHN